MRIIRGSHSGRREYRRCLCWRHCAVIAPSLVKELAKTASKNVENWPRNREKAGEICQKTGVQKVQKRKILDDSSTVKYFGCGLLQTSKNPHTDQIM
uniref:Uncharacterized protein n=1 Tax=Romanomermis culicivorax TaxID=13658 RepID=A0A915JPG7_ROMCU